MMLERLTDALCERIAAVAFDDLGADTVARVKDAAGDPVMPVAFALAEVTDCSGRDIVTVCAKGFEIQHRAIKPEEHMKKMRDCLSGRFSESEISRCYETVNGLDRVDASGVRKLIDLLGRDSNA